MELQTVLGPVEFTTVDILDSEVPTDLEAFPYKEGKLCVPADTWYADEPSKGQGAKEVAISVQPAIDHI